MLVATQLHYIGNLLRGVCTDRKFVPLQIRTSYYMYVFYLLKMHVCFCHVALGSMHTLVVFALH